MISGKVDWLSEFARLVLAIAEHDQEGTAIRHRAFWAQQIADLQRAKVAALQLVVDGRKEEMEQVWASAAPAAYARPFLDADKYE